MRDDPRNSWPGKLPPIPPPLRTVGPPPFLPPIPTAGSATPPPFVPSVPHHYSPPSPAPAFPRVPNAGRVTTSINNFFSPHQPATPKGSILSPAELERFGNLLMFARSTVEGYFAGKHKSPFRGSSVEFADYKEYVPGDDIKHIDWRAYGRSRKLFLRQYEAETDMVVYLMVDVSASMSYVGTGKESKYILAAKIAAAFAYLMTQQSDKAALALFADKVRHFTPPGGTRGHLHNMVFQLETATPASTTGIAAALMECDPLFKKRGRLVVLSDFWDELEPTFEALSRFQHRKFEILLLQIVNPHELDLYHVHAARFHDMETHESIEVEPDEIREAYADSAREWVERTAAAANLRGMSHAVVSTDRPYLDAIEAYLGFRGRNTLSTR